MKRVIAALVRQDLKAVSRDTMMIVALLGPFMYAATIWFVPALTEMAARDWNFDLVPYHQLIVSSFCVLGASVMLGVLLGMQLLDEKDQRTVTALKVTPLPRFAYPAYRAAVVVVLATFSTVAALFLTRIVPGEVLLKSIPVGVLGGLFSVTFGLAMGGISGNKVEGLAVARVLGIAAFTLPAIPFFLRDSPVELLFGLLPPYWPARAFWAAWDGTTFWPYILGGLVVNVAAALLLLRVVARRLD